MPDNSARAGIDSKYDGPTDEASLEIVPILQGYFQEAENARKGGLNPRDAKWEENLHLYWNRYDHSKKAAWQAAENLPEVPTFVDRFAAALKEALVTGSDGFYSIEDPADAEGDLTEPIKRMMNVWLSVSGHNQNGTCLGFPAVFEEQVKLGAMMACSSVVTWKEDVDYGRVAIETVDPRNVYLDPTYRNLYRIRRIELDKHELKDMVRMQDRKGESIYNREAIERMVSHIEMDAQKNREDMTGSGAMQTSTRQPITMDEYIATVVGNDGEVIAKDALMVVGNNKFLIRGPEKNPFWHGKDWLTFCPLVTTPLSVYGRTYMEDFGSLATTFNNLTNLLLDAVQVSAMKVFVAVPEMLANPAQLNDGISPNKVFLLEDGVDPRMFLSAVDLGSMPPEAIQIWQAMKAELREAADLNEVGLGQFAPKGRTSATEVSQTQESSSALIRSVAQTVETRWLDPVLDLVWQTGLQHAQKGDQYLMSAAGEDMYGALLARRKELIMRPVTFQARGISSLIQKQRMLRALLQVMGYMAQSPELLQAFMQEADLQKFVKLLFKLSDVDMSKVTISARERMMRDTVQKLQGAAGMQQPMQPGTATQGEGAQVAQMMGVGK